MKGSHKPRHKPENDDTIVRHVAYSVCLKVASIYTDKKTQWTTRLYRGSEEECFKNLFEWLMSLSKLVRRTLKVNNEIVMTPADDVAYSAATCCYVCGGGSLKEMMHGARCKTTTTT